jgi:hypothetical protein
MSGELHQKTISKAFPISKTALWIEVLLLILLGAIAITLKSRIRIPLDIPGHHGLEVMAILMIGRSISGISFASTISSVAAGLLMFFPFLGIKDPFLPLSYLLMGVTIDYLYYLWNEKKNQWIFISLIGGLAYMIIPLSRLIITFTTGYPYGSFIKSGFAVPLISHFIFGVAGAILGAGLIISLRKFFRKQ